jgi:O-antigen/teichoic acid export membrane protein
MTYFLSRKEINEKELVTISLLWSLIAGGLAAALLIFSRNDYFSTTRYSTFGYSFLFITGMLLTTYFSGLFFARRQFTFPHLIPAIMNIIVGLFCGVLFISEKKTDTSTMVTVYFASFIVNGIVLSILYRSKYSTTFLLHLPEKSTVIKLLRYSSVAFIANIVSFLAYRVDYWILKGFSPRIITADAMGNYIQVAKLVQLFLFAPTIVATVVFPTFASGNDLSLNKEFKKMIWRVLLSNIAACGAMLIAGRWLFTFLYGNSFSLMYMCFVFSVPAILAITVVRILASYFAGTNRIKYNLAGGLIALVVIVVFNFLLIPLMGINGAALADSAGYTACMLFLLLFFIYRG